jgi:C_GCAxxG_C_C family probable redox protein
MGEVCGAVSGALMVIGLKEGVTELENKDGKEKVYNLACEFAAQFKARNKSTLCRELLDCDLTDPEEYHRARERGLFASRCPKYVHDSTEILMDLLEK